MNKCISPILIILLVTFAKPCLFAQSKGSIRGVVVSSGSDSLLENATVNLLLQKDSSTVGYKITDKTGSFNITNVSFGKYILSLTYIGHEYLEIPFSFDQKTFSFDTIRLAPSSSSLDEIIVTARKPPMVVKEDTLEFNADSYKTKPEALAEDVLKKLPGVEVDRDGNITVQGEEITQVYVDGKPFFGGDFKMATQNLPANIIDKIQLIDEKNDKARFTRVDDGQRKKVINITIKKDKKVGHFGRFNAGYGTQDRYNGRGMFNKFTGDRQMSVFGSANNINASGRGDQRNDDGLNNSQRLGVNYRNRYDNKLDVSSSLSFNNNESMTIVDEIRQNLNSGASSTNIENRRGNRNNQGYNWNADLEYKPDTMMEVRARINASYGDNSSKNFSDNLVLVAKDTTSSGFRNNFNDGNTLNFSGELNVMKRFRKDRRSMTFGVNANNGFNNGDDRLEFLNQGIDRFGDPFIDERNQLTSRESNNNRINFSLSYTEPVFKSNMLEFSYNYNWNKNNSVRNTFDWDGDKYGLFNDSLSNAFLNRSNNQRAGLKFVGLGNFYNYNVGVEMQDILQDNLNISKDSLVSQDFTNFLPSAGITFFNKKGRNINFFYRGQVQQPTLQQLQPVPDPSNPQYIYSGNPNLQNEFTNHFNYKYNEFFRNSEISISLSGNYSATQNKIINFTTIDRERGIRNTRPVNVDGVWQTGSHLDFSMPIIKKVLRYSLDFRTNYQNGASFVDSALNEQRNFNYGIGGRINLDVGDWLEFSYRTRYSTNRVSYSLSNERNTVFYTDFHSIDISVETPGEVEFRSGFDLRKNRGNTEQFNQQVALWNASVSKHLMKRKMEVSIQAFDLLNQNQSIVRNITEDYISDVVRNTLTQYFMLNISYRLSKFPGGGPGGRPGGGRR